MNDNRKEIVFVIGKSKNMDRDAMLKGFNTLAEAQKKIKDESTYTLVFFDDEVKISALCKPMKSIRKYNSVNFTTKGRSSFYDALGTAMVKVGEVLSETDEAQRPCQVCVVAIGEGDSASTEYEHSVLDEMIKRQKYIYKWDFILFSDEDMRFDIGKGGDLKNPEKMFADIGDYITGLRKAVKK